MQEATRCDRWIQDSSDAINFGRRRVRWNQRVSSTLSTISSSRKSESPAHRCGYKATTKAEEEACPRYWEELHRISALPSAPGTPTVPRSSSVTTVHHTATIPNLRGRVLSNGCDRPQDGHGEVTGTTGFIRSAGNPNLRGYGGPHAHHHDQDAEGDDDREGAGEGQLHRVYAVGSSVVRGVGGALGRATKDGWRKTRTGVAAGVDRLLNRSSNNNSEGADIIDNSRINDLSCHLKQRHQSPAAFSNAPGHEDKLLGSERASREATNVRTLGTSVGVNAFVFAMAGLRFMKKRRRVRLIPRRQWGLVQAWRWPRGWKRVGRRGQQWRWWVQQWWCGSEQGGDAAVWLRGDGGNGRVVSSVSVKIFFV